jgi:sugar lactone lactonase YvrE
MGRATRVLCEGIYYGEGLRWRNGRLWLSDFFGHKVHSVAPAGDLRTEIELDDQPSGLGWMPDGSLLFVSMKKRQVLRRAVDGKITLHADLRVIADFHTNDMVVDSKGRAYVGNFGFDLYTEVERRGIQSVFADHATAKLALVLPDGIARVAAEGMHFPNGSVITPDGKTLVVGESFSGDMIAFDIAGDGSLSNRRIWASILPRVPDGIALNADGNIWVANPLAPECVLVAEGGKIVDVMETDWPCYSCMLGGEDGHTLFISTAPTFEAHIASASPKGKIVIARVDVPHAGLP